MKALTVAYHVALWKMKTGFFMEQKAVCDLRLALAVHQPCALWSNVLDTEFLVFLCPMWYRRILLDGRKQASLTEGVKLHIAPRIKFWKYFSGFQQWALHKKENNLP